ncbi:MAG: copper chaperone PCu(A)C [Burkholderiaceae bacterium]
MKKQFIAFALLGALLSPASAQTSVTDAWVRGTVPAQKATGAFMRIVSQNGARLIQADSSVADVVEIHEMAMEGNVMKMRPVTGLDLPAGKAVALEPGGYHIMLMGLKRPLNEGELLPITLVIEGQDGARESMELNVPVRPLTAAMPAMQHGAEHGKHRH